MGKEYLKKTGEELQQYLQFKRRGSRVKAKKVRALSTIVIVKKTRRESNLRNDKMELSGASPFLPRNGASGVTNNRM